MQRLDLIGFGAVGQALVRLLAARPLRTPTAIASITSRSTGTVLAPDPRFPLPISPAIPPPDSWHASWIHMPYTGTAAEIADVLAASPGNVVVENMPLAPDTGQPASDVQLAAFAAGRSVVSSNKGPLAHAYAELAGAAGSAGVAYRFESAVMDGTPVFSLVEQALPGARVVAFRGVLNSTTNHILTVLEGGGSAAEAIADAQAAGFAEADPSVDVDGWDGAAKFAALLNVFGYTAGDGVSRTSPAAIPRDSVAGVTAADVAGACGRGARLKVVCHGDVDGATGGVALEEVEVSDPLAHVAGASSALTLVTDLMGELTITETNPTIAQTAYGNYADLAHISKSMV